MEEDVRVVEVAELRSTFVPRKEWVELDADTVGIKRTANYGRVELHILFRLPSSYPMARPSIRVRAVKGIDAEECIVLQSLLAAEAEARVGSAMIAALIATADDWIEDKVLNSYVGESSASSTATTAPSTTSSTTSTSSATAAAVYEDLDYEDTKDFKCFTAAEIISIINKEVQYIQELLKVPQTTARILLSHYMWNTERLVSDFLDSPSRVFMSIRATGTQVDESTLDDEEPASSKGKEKRVVDDDGGEDKQEKLACPGCFDDSPDYTKLSCGHAFCNDCYKEYLSIKIKDGQADKIFCPAYKCTLTVPESIVKTLVDEEAFKKYNSFLANSYVENNPYVMWCPAPGCQYAVKATVKLNCTVTCTCGNSFCFKCKQEGHYPCTCGMVERWAKHSKAEKETFQYISKFTRDCPNCETPIEKNGGCNKMTCSYCNFMFCWICMQDWKSHNFFYSCNRFDPKKKKVNAKPSTSLLAAATATELFSHHYERYLAHDRARNFETQIKAATREKLRQLQEATARLASSTQSGEQDRKKENALFASVNDAAALEKDFTQAINALLQCRRLLKYSYVLSYVIAVDQQADEKSKGRATIGSKPKPTAEKTKQNALPSTELYEFMQEDLEIATEKLSEVLEGSLVSNTPEGQHNSDPYQFFNAVSQKRSDILGAMQTALQRLRNIIDLIEREFVPEEEEEPKNKRGRKGVAGGVHPSATQNTICIGEWSYPIDMSLTATSTTSSPASLPPKKTSEYELKKWEALGFVVDYPAQDDGEKPIAEDDDEDYEDEEIEYIPEKVLKKRVRKDDFGRPQAQYLIKWKGLPESEATWVAGTDVECVKLAEAYEREHKAKIKANMAKAKAAAGDESTEKPAPKKKKVKKQKEDLDPNTRQGKEKEFLRTLEEQIKFISKQDLGSLHTLSQDMLKQKSNQFIAEYYRNLKEQSGMLLSWGANSDGVLGHNGGIEQLWPLAVEALAGHRIKAVAAGEFHSLCLTESGEVISFGLNDQGQCGQPIVKLDEKKSNLIASARPRPITLSEELRKKTIVSISAGGYHSALITADGELYTFGRGGEFQLGHESVMALGEGSALRRNESAQASYFQVNSTRVSSLDGKVVKQVACGRFHTACVTEDGGLYTWGRGANGQLGHGDMNDQPLPKKVEGSLKNVHIVKVGCGENHTAAISASGWIYTSGGDEHGQLGKPEEWICGTHGGDCQGLNWNCQERIPVPKTQQETFLDIIAMRPFKFVDIECGYGFCAAITSSGQLFTWGKGTALGLGPVGDTYTPTLVKGLTGVVKISCGDVNAAAMTDTGQLYMWGSSEMGRLGDGRNADHVVREPKLVPAFADIHQARCVDVSVGSSHVLAVSSLSSSLSAILGEALDNPEFTDVTFLLEGRYSVRAHQAVLTARSKHFRELFAKRRQKEQASNEIPVKKVTLETFKRLLEYIYRDHIAADMSKAVATQLSQVAKAFKMERLQAMCDSFLEREVDLIPKSTFSEDMKTILNDPTSSEVKFSFPMEEGGESEEQLIHAHRSILGIRSSYFGGMWRSGMRETTQSTIPITYADRKSFLIAVEYIYTDDISEEMDLDLDSGVSLLSLADLLELPRLRDLTEKKMLRLVRVDNCAILYHIATLHRAELLKRYCMEVVFQQYAAVSRTPAFAELPEDVRESLIAMHSAWWRKGGGSARH